VKDPFGNKNKGTSIFRSKSREKSSLFGVLERNEK